MIGKASFSFAQITTEHLSQSKEWLNLLHYRHGKSLINDKQFFISPNGNNDAQAELNATIQALQTNTKSIACKYPARVSFLSRSLPALKELLPKVPCYELREYIEQTSATSISFVFATESINSPLSSMGHAFFKIKGKRASYHPAHSLSFFADLSKAAHPLVFIPKAIVTGTEGVYILEPYRDKVAKYVDTEKRSLIEYPLKLTRNELDFLLLHIWEMKGIRLNYNLKQHNCASALIDLLKVAKPEYEDILYKSYLTPSDIITRLKRAHAIRDEETSYQTPALTEKKPVIKKNGASQAGFYTGLHHDKMYVNILYAPAYHDVMEFNASFGKEFEVSLFKADISYYPELEKIKLNEFIFYKAQNFIPTTLEERKLSKSVEISIKTNPQNFGTAPYPFIAGGLGYTAETPYQNFIPYLYIRGGYDWLHNDSNFFLSPEMGAFLYVNEENKLLASLNRTYNSVDGKQLNGGKVAYAYRFSPQTSLRTEFSRAGDSDSLKLGIYLTY